MSDVDAAWARAQARGRRKQRPKIFGIVTGVVVTLVSAVGMMLYLEADEQDKQARLARGEVVIEIRRRGSSGIIGILALPVLLGFSAGFAVFKKMGGKMDPAYSRGLSE